MNLGGRLCFKCNSKTHLTNSQSGRVEGSHDRRGGGNGNNCNDGVDRGGDSNNTNDADLNSDIFTSTICILPQYGNVFILLIRIRQLTLI